MRWSIVFKFEPDLISVVGVHPAATRSRVFRHGWSVGHARALFGLTRRYSFDRPFNG